MPLTTHHLAPPTNPTERLPEEWADVLGSWGMPRYRGQQIFHWIYRHGVFDPHNMKNLPKRLQARLVEEGLGVPLHVSTCWSSKDGTRKLLVRMHDNKEVETVLLPQQKRVVSDVGDGFVSGNVVTQCISSQVGCAMGCVFCASGVAGLDRHLSAAEIVSQVLVGRAYLKDQEHTRNIVFMGMGEPLHNYDNVARALVLLTHPEGLNMSSRRITLSTSGLIPQIDRLATDFDGQVQLAISLHAVTDERRSSIMPINRKYNLAALMDCLKRYPMPKRRRITIEYTLIEGVNDDLAQADALIRWLHDVPAKINLIPMNSIAGSELHAPSHRRVHAFRERLCQRGISAFVRKQRGDDIAAACGQLVFLGKNKRPRKRA